MVNCVRKDVTERNMSGPSVREYVQVVTGRARRDDMGDWPLQPDCRNVSREITI